MPATCSTTRSSGSALRRAAIKRGPTTGSLSSMPACQCRALRTAGEQADAGRDQDLPVISRSDHRRDGQSPRHRHARPDTAHESTTAALNHRRAAAPFGHGAAHDIGKLRIFASYHCSRYNTNTGVLTPKMFQDVFAAARAYLDA